MDVPETSYARSGERFIGYQIWGRNGVDLLEFCHAANFSIEETANEPRWLRYERRLASFTRLIRFDPSGIGLSDARNGEDDRLFESWADDAISVLDEVGVSQAALIAGAVGGCAALVLAARHPERVSSLVLVNCGARITAAPDYDIGLPSDYWASLTKNAEPTADDRERSDDIAFVAPSLAGDETFRGWWSRASRRSASPSLAQQINEALVHFDGRALLSEIQVPTLVVARSDTVVTNLSRYLAAHIPRAHLVEVPGRDMLAYAGDPEPILNEVEEFFTGQRLGANAERVFAAVMFSDVVGSTALAARLGDREFKVLLEDLTTTVRNEIGRRGGRFVKDTGDGALATFDRPTQAIESAHAMHDGARRIGLTLRIGIHAGEIELRGEDVGGIAVHTAARICALGAENETLVSSTVADLVSGSNVRFQDRGAHELKGIPGLRQLLAVEE
jgi:class 3 adenylate cyclase